jgi:hypothetical protein
MPCRALLSWLGRERAQTASVIGGGGEASREGAAGGGQGWRPVLSPANSGGWET